MSTPAQPFFRLNEKMETTIRPFEKLISQVQSYVRNTVVFGKSTDVITDKEGRNWYSNHEVVHELKERIENVLNHDI